MKNGFTRKLVWYGIGAVLFLSLMSAGYYAFVPLNGIYEVNESRDLSFLTQTFTRDLYWLTTASSHDAAYMVKHHAKSKEPQDEGKLVIKVGYERNKPVGFVAYYMENFYTGKVLFLDVHPDFRAQRWGYKLLDYAVKKLIQQGALKVELITRVNNSSARSLYTKYGFKETGRDEEFVNYEFRPS